MKLFALAEPVEPLDAGVVWALSVAWRTHSWRWALRLVPAALAIVHALEGELWSEYLCAITLEGEEAVLCSVGRHAFVLVRALDHGSAYYRSCPVAKGLSRIVEHIRAALSLILNEGVKALAVVGSLRGKDRGTVDLTSVDAHVDVRAPLIAWQVVFIDVATLVRHV